MSKVLYYERQHFSLFAYLIALAMGIGGLILLVPAPGSEEGVDFEQRLTGLVLLLVSVIIINLLTMSTWVYGDFIRIRFGRLIPYYSKRIPLREVREARTVDYKPLRQAGGWGIRGGRFEGRWVRFLNARGDRGVLLETGDKPWIIGTQFPDKLSDVISGQLYDAHGRKRSSSS